MRSMRTGVSVPVLVAGLSCLALCLMIDQRMPRSAVVAAAQASTTTVVEVYARGLVNPKGMVFASDGTLYVAESGQPGEVMVPLPVNFGGTGPIGTNGRISHVPPGGSRQDFVTGLPNIGLYGGVEMLGPTGMAFLDGQLYELAGGHMTVSPTLSRVGPDGTLTHVADIGAFNRANPPPSDNGDAVPMGNPFGLVALDGQLYVTDGNYNRVLRVGLDGSVSIVAAFSNDPTTTGAAAGPDGNLYVAQFGLAPYTPGSSRIDRVSPDGLVEEAVVGNLTTPTAAAFAGDGSLYVLQFAAEFLPDKLRYVPFGGAVLRVEPNGLTRPVVTNLVFPTAMITGPDGALYVANYGNEANDGQGQVLRIVPGEQPESGPAVPAPDDSRAYAPVQSASGTRSTLGGGVAGTIRMVETADPSQWGFEPADLSIHTGEAVEFTNSGRIAHTVTDSQGAFDTGLLKASESAVITFNEPGTYSYFCQPHPWMKGSVTVQGESKTAGSGPQDEVPVTDEQQASMGPMASAVFAGLIIAALFAAGLLGWLRQRHMRNKPPGF